MLIKRSETFATFDFDFFLFLSVGRPLRSTLFPLHDALPISLYKPNRLGSARCAVGAQRPRVVSSPDRKSTRLNSSHQITSYAVFCLKKKKIRSSTNTCPLPQRIALIGS